MSSSKVGHCIKGMFSILKFSFRDNIFITSYTHIYKIDNDEILLLFLLPEFHAHQGTGGLWYPVCWWSFQTSQFLKGVDRNPGMRYVCQMPFWILLQVSGMAENCAVIYYTWSSLENLLL